jgi:hypothetical protein
MGRVPILSGSRPVMSQPITVAATASGLDGSDV